MGFFDGPLIKRTIMHSQAPTEVIQRLDAQLTDKLKAAFPDVRLTNVRQQWRGQAGTFSCKVNGHDVSGKMSVNPTQLNVEVQLPFGASTQIDVDAVGTSIHYQLTALLA